MERFVMGLLTLIIAVAASPKVWAQNINLQILADRYNNNRSVDRFIAEFYGSYSATEKEILRHIYRKQTELPELKLKKNVFLIGEVQLEVINLENKEFKLNTHSFNYNSKRWAKIQDEWVYFTRILNAKISKPKKQSHLIWNSLFVPIAFAEEFIELSPIASALAREMESLSFAERIRRLKENMLPSVWSQDRVQIKVSCQTKKSPSSMSQTMQNCWEMPSISGGRIHEMSIHFQRDGESVTRTFYQVMGNTHLDCSENCPIKSLVVIDSEKPYSSLENACRSENYQAINFGMSNLSSKKPKNGFKDPMDTVLAKKIYESIQGCCDTVDDWWGDCESEINDEFKYEIRSGNIRTEIQTREGAR